MWCSCDCNFFIKLLCTIILIFTIIINGFGNLIGVGDIIEETRFCPCHTTVTEPSTTEASTEILTTEPLTVPTATLAPSTTTEKHTTAVHTTETTENITVTVKPTTQAPTTQEPTTQTPTTAPQSRVPQPNIVVYDELNGVLVSLPEVEGASEVSAEISPYIEFTPDYMGNSGFLNLEPGRTYSIRAYAIINGVKELSDPVVFTTYKNPVPPSPTVKSITHDTITIEPIDGCEYRVRSTANYVAVDWTESTVFTGLTPSWDYKIEVRYKANGYHAESMNPTVLFVDTLEAPTTTVAPTTAEPTTTTTTKPSTTKTSTTKGTTLKPITTQGGPFVNSASQIALSVFGGSSIPTANGYMGTHIRNIDATSDGGYVACGTTSSSDGDFASVYDSSKSWRTPVSFVAKFSRAGTVEWVKLFGDSKANIYFCDIAVLDNGNIAVAGYIQYPSQIGVDGRIDAIVYTLSLAGSTLSEKEYSGSGSDDFYCISATSTGYVVGGKTTSTDGAFEGIPGKSSVIINFDFDGNVLWKHYLSGSKGSNIEDIDVDKNGNIFAACVTTATDGEFEAFGGLIGNYSDTVILKYNYAGEYQWHHVLATSGTDIFGSVVADDKGGCLVAGNYTLISGVVPDGTLEGIHNCGDTDALAIRLGSDGRRLWYKIISGFYDDYITDAVCVDGGFAVTGYTTSSNREFAPMGNMGGSDGFVYFLTWNGTGVEVLSQAGSADDEATCLAYSAENRELLVAGKTESPDGSFTDKNTYYPGNIGYVSRYKITTK